MGYKIKAHVILLPRWFAAPLFGAPIVLGGLLAGGMTFTSWIGLLAGLLVMAGGHSLNSALDYAWTGLDRGEKDERSAEKSYTIAQNSIAKGILSVKEVYINGLCWYVLAFIPLTYLALRVGYAVLFVGAAGMSITFLYAKAKFNWTHELVLGVAVGPLAVLTGMSATSGSPPWGVGLLASVPFSIITSFAGLALDEWPDAKANVAKGVKSIAYKVWENGVSLEWYLSSWFLFSYMYQVFLIQIGILHPLSALSFSLWPMFIGGMVFLRTHFKKAAGVIVAAALADVTLIVLGHALGKYL
jgi:1,4-dihydroxy-2-naphthoate octaprenyltransferase